MSRKRALSRNRPSPSWSNSKNGCAHLSMVDVLQDIAGQVQKDLALEMQRVPLSQLKRQAREMPFAIPFEKSIRREGEISVIAELKQASPSAGVIRLEPRLEERVDGYVQGGAHALSILTERHYFHGSPEILQMARRRVKLPILRK